MPFGTVDIANCSACVASQAGASGYQFAPGAVCAARCIPLGYPSGASVQPLDPSSPAGGVRIVFAGGMGGRQLVHHVTCAPGKPLAAVGDLTMGDGGYLMRWAGEEGCGAAAACPAPPPLAKPTAAQLAWQDKELGALIHFNVGSRWHDDPRPPPCPSASASPPTPSLKPS